MVCKRAQPHTGLFKRAPNRRATAQPSPFIATSPKIYVVILMTHPILGLAKIVPVVSLGWWRDDLRYFVFSIL